MWDETVRLFTEMPVLAAVLLLIGIVLVAIETLEPGIGVPGILGIAALIAGITVRMLADGTVWMFILLLFTVGVILSLILFLFLRSARKGWLSKTALFDATPSVPYDKTEGTPDFTALIGKTAVAVTALRPVGKIKADGNFYDAVSDGGFIKKGESVVIKATEGAAITVGSVL